MGYKGRVFYPFGMLMPGRKYSQPNSSYRYGFNGKEKSDEIRGDGNSYDFGNRILDARLGRWLSPDPITKSFLSSYAFGLNNPTNFIDPDGADDIHFFFYYDKTALGRAINGPLRKFAVIVKNNEPNRFIHHKTTLTEDPSGKQTLTDKATEFYPMNYGSASGLTKSKVFGFNIKDNDYETLMKYTDEFPEIQQEAKYIEVGQTGSSKSRKVANAQFWGSVIANNKARKANEEVMKNKLALAEGVLVFAVTEYAVARLFFAEGAAIALTKTDKFFESSVALDRNGLTKVGRALQKHAGREGSSFADIQFSGKTGNEDALQVLNNILSSKNQLVKDAENGGKLIFDQTTGRGVGVSRNGEFNGFRDIKNEPK